MPWIKVDDQWNNHPKVVGLSLAARGMWISGLVYAGQQLTDGFLADSVVKREGIGTDSDALAEELVAAGLWNRVEHGYQIHDYLDFNPSREEVMTKRKADLERKKRPSQQDSPQIPRGIQTESKRPVPVPVPLNEKDESFSLASDDAPKTAKYSEEFEAWWKQYPKGRGSKAKSFAEWKRLSAADRAAATAEMPVWLSCDQWKDPQYIVYAERWLKNRAWENPPAKSAPTLRIVEPPDYLDPEEIMPSGMTRWEEKWGFTRDPEYIRARES